MYYFVSTSGNDSYSGDVLNPFATLSRAQTVARTGDTIFFRGGTYTDYTAITKAVTLSGYENETAIIQPSTTTPAAAMLISASGTNQNRILIRNLVVDATNRWRGIDIGGAFITVLDCEVKNCVGKVTDQYGQGITVTDSSACHDITITNPTIHNVGGTESSTGYCHAIYSAREGTVITGGEYYDIGGYAVHFFSSQGTITGDLIASNMYIHDSYGGVGVFTGRALVYNNVIRNHAVGLMARYSVINAQFYHNTLVDGGGTDASALGDGAVVVFINNVYLRTDFAAHWEQFTPTTAVVSATNNLRDGNTYSDYRGGYASAWDVSYVSGSFAPITDDGGAGIVPLNGNPAIGAGAQVVGVSTDRAGTARNLPATLGAWQYNPPTTYLLSRGSGRATPSRSSVFSNRGLNTP